MQRAWAVLLLLLIAESAAARRFESKSPSTTNNDDSCDIALMPAATLLLPYFEVEVASPRAAARTTLFSLTNVSPVPQIAQVTLWTDLGRAVLTFPIFLTGYDVQSIDLYEVLVHGAIGTGGTAGRMSLPNYANPNFVPFAAEKCAVLPSSIPAPLLAEARSALTTGRSAATCGAARVGLVHVAAIGYATIDVVAGCDVLTPADGPAYFRQLLFDNVLTGDYHDLDPDAAQPNAAGGGPMVHIRAVPEGGPAGETTATNLPFTFYDRFTAGAPSRRIDRRQPLPSRFAAPWSDSGLLNTDIKIWREGTTAGTSSCADLYVPEVGQHQPVSIVRFDEHENSRTLYEGGFCIPGGCLALVLPLASRSSSSSSVFPFVPSDFGDVRGWVFMNLDNRGRAAYSSSQLLAGPDTRTGPRPSQEWVVVSTRGELGISSEVPATAMANGCSPPAANPGFSQRPTAPIAPGENVVSAPPRQGSPATTNNDDSCDIAVMPAATLVLPYFEVDFNAPSTTARTTVFQVTNVSNVPQIVHATVWTDLGYPIFDFNLFLTGYDVQVINMYDVINRGVIGPFGTSNLTTPGARSLANGANPHFLPQAAATCSSLPGRIPQSYLNDLRFGLTTGQLLTCGTTRVGRTHQNAIGYVTLDVVADCSTTLPTDPAYFERELLFDNVLTGDYYHFDGNPSWRHGTGAPLIHVRAIPEGGPAGVRGATNLPSTFYDRLTPDVDRRIDRRQPLPSLFAARFVEGGPAGFSTSAQIWREAVTRMPFANGCRGYTANEALPVAEIVRFDEHENPVAMATATLPLPLASATPASSAAFPSFSSPAGDVGGWMYLNLNDAAPRPRPRQAWVTMTMFARGRFATAADATAMGNGCSAAPAAGARIAPAPNGTP